MCRVRQLVNGNLKDVYVDVRTSEKNYFHRFLNPTYLTQRFDEFDDGVAIESYGTGKYTVNGNHDALITRFSYRSFYAHYESRSNNYSYIRICSINIGQRKTQSIMIKLKNCQINSSNF